MVPSFQHRRLSVMVERHSGHVLSRSNHRHRHSSQNTCCRGTKTRSKTQGSREPLILKEQLQALFIMDYFTMTVLNDTGLFCPRGLIEKTAKFQKFKHRRQQNNAVLLVFYKSHFYTIFWAHSYLTEKDYRVPEISLTNCADVTCLAALLTACPHSITLNETGI